MKNCTHCKYAEWHKTSVGKLHPSGEGRCKFEYKLPLLPAAFVWLTFPKPAGGYINRRKDNKEHCPYFAMNN